MVEPMSKIAVIVLSLVNESATIGNEEIEEQIQEELATDAISRIPWAKKVEKVAVTEI